MIQRNVSPPPVRPSGVNGQVPRKTFTRSSGVSRRAHKIGIYGPEGAGKSSLAATFPGIVFADIEHSTEDLNVKRDEGINEWTDLRAWAQQLDPHTTPAACVDSMTRAEDWCAKWVIANKKSNENVKATDSLEDFKYKAGLIFCCDEFGRFLADLDAAHARGVNVLMIAHSRIARFRNPDGSDYLRAEPRLINDDKASNMLAWVQFLDHLFCIDFDVAADKGKAKGTGTRTIYTAQTATRMAKSRTLDGEPVYFEKGSSKLWTMLAGTVAANDEMPQL